MFQFFPGSGILRASSMRLILRIHDMYNLQLGVLMYKFTRQELSRSLMSLYEYRTTPHDTRHGQDPILPVEFVVTWVPQPRLSLAHTIMGV